MNKLPQIVYNNKTNRFYIDCGSFKTARQILNEIKRDLGILTLSQYAKIIEREQAIEREEEYKELCRRDNGTKHSPRFESGDLVKINDKRFDAYPNAWFIDRVHHYDSKTKQFYYLIMGIDKIYYPDSMLEEHPNNHKNDDDEKYFVVPE